MLTISADLSSLSTEQRKALSTFVLTFPEVERFAKRSGDPVPAQEEPQDSGIQDEQISPEDAFGTSSALLNAGVINANEAKAIEAEPFYKHGANRGERQAIYPAPPASNVDKHGLPWDERIHSSSKNFTADGSWRKKRNVADALVAEVEAQLRQVMSLPAPAAQASVPPPPAPSASVPPAPGPTLVPAPVDMDGRQAYINLVGRASKAMQDGKITKEESDAILANYGIPKFSLLTNRFDLIPQIAMDFEQLLAGR